MVIFYIYNIRHISLDVVFEVVQLLSISNVNQKAMRLPVMIKFHDD